MLSRFNTIPNQLTGLRLLLIPILWVMAVLGQPVWIGVGLAIAFITDALDGYLARRLNQTTDFGGRLDSLADNILLPSAVVWLFLLRPRVILDHPLVAAAAVAIYLCSISVGWLKHRRFGDLHLYLSKAAGLTQYVFIIATFIFNQVDEQFFYLTALIWSASSLETLILQLALPRVDAHIGSVALLVAERRYPGVTARVRRLMESLYLM